MNDHTEYVDGRAEPAFIDAVHDAMERLWAAVPGIGDEDRDMFALAVSEIVTNVVEHASGRESISVTAQVSATARDLCAVLTDDAHPALIDLEAVSMPGVDAESGRGLALALASLDELIHEPGAGNKWRLLRHRRG